jgi:GNAT superfamily N-acetyltransferase
MMHIKPSTPVDYEGMATFYKILYPQADTTTASLKEEDDERNPDYRYNRWIAVENGQVIGLGYHNQSNWFSGPQNFTMWIGVLPERRRQGIGTALYQTIINGLEPYDPLGLRSFTPSDRPQSIAFLTSLGFNEIIRDIQSELDVQAFNFTRFKIHRHAYMDDGITIKTVPELASDPDRNQKLYDLDWDLSMAVPGDLAAGMGRRGLDQYVQYAITGNNVPPDAFFVAVRGGEYIGMSHLLISEKGVSFYQGLTGVRPEFQHQGLGLALKLKAIAYAKQNGYKIIRSENDARNIPMLKLNEKLGFARKSELITFEKQLQ